jgi:SpoIID/LytB domain protein
MKRALILVVAVALMAVWPAGAGHASKEFTFYGAGWGHGLGMSQYGAYGLALEGWGYKKILRHFYTGTQVGTAPWSPGKLRVGLVQGKHTLHLKAVGGPVRLRVGSPSGKVVGGRAIPKGETWQVQTRPSGEYRVLDASGKSVDGHLWGGVSTHLYATYAGDGARVYVTEAGNHYNRGHLELNLYKGDGCASGYCERVVAVLTPQAYLYGLAEVPNSWPADARKAQAVAARTYAFEKAHRLGQHRPKCNCALYDDTFDQVYAGWDKEGSVLGNLWVDAVEATAGQTVLHQGSLIQAYYHSSSGGHTENNELAWGGSPLSYLRGVCDTGDYVDGNPNRTWTVGPMSASTVTTKLKPYTGGIGTVTGFSDISRGVSGQVLTLTVEGEKGSATISGAELAVGLGLKGDKVWINSNRLVTGEIRDTYDANLCGPGDVAGPRVKVPGGVRQRFEQGTIYLNDARDRAYWLRGPVHDEYLAEGEASGVLGLPRTGLKKLTAPQGCGKATCRRARFEEGWIYYKNSDGVGAHTLHGDVLDYFLDHQGASGLLGFPTTDVVTDGNGGTSASFEHGTVTCATSGVCTQS